MTEHICPPDHLHGDTAACYVSHGCRCGECRRGRAEYEYWRRYQHARGRELMIDATGTRRRLQALIALGWGSRAISVRCGRSVSWVTHVLYVPKVRPATAELVSRIYDEMSMTVPEATNRHERGGITKARRWARQHGWALPLQWDDDTIDDPNALPAAGAALKDAPRAKWAERCDEAAIAQAVAGEQIRLAPLERRAVVRQLWARQWSDRTIARYANCTDRQVLRIREELGLHAWEMWEMESAA